MSGYVYKTHKQDGTRALCREVSARTFSDNPDEVTCRGCLEILGVVYTCSACKVPMRGPRAWLEHIQTHCKCPARERPRIGAYSHHRLPPPRYHITGCPALEVARIGGR